jgi:hypothetical protein
MTYVLVFCGNSYHSNTLFKLQKRINGIMAGTRDKEPCREYFRKLKILPLQSEYLYLLLSFVINNRQHFKINSDIYIYKNVTVRLCVVCSKSQSSESCPPMALQFGPNVAGEYARVWI